MNLGQYLANIILEGEDQPTIALFPGAFKPPHKGHFDVIEKLLQAADQVVVIVSPQTREGVTADESIAVWDLYKNKFNGPVEIKISADASPVKEVYNVVKDNPDTNFIVAFGKGEMDRYKSIEKYPNVKVFDAGAVEGVNATNLRMALAQNNNEEIAKYLPNGILVDQFLQALSTKSEKVPDEIPSTKPAPDQPLKESPPIEFEQDDYQDYTLQNRHKIEKAAAVFNLPIADMEYAFNAGREVVLSDDIWDKMENTESYKMKTLDDAIAHALKLGINPRPYIDYIKKGKEMPLPLVLCYSPNKYYLVGGEIILSLYRALGSIPTVLQGTLNLQTKTLHQPLEEGKNVDTVNIGSMKLKDEQIDLIKKFLKYAVKALKLHKLPSGLTLSYDTAKAKHRHTFGTFDPETNKVWLYVKDRNVADLLRTLAHELVHRKQAEEGRIDYNSGDTGSEIENEANAQAGVLLRNFGKHHEDIYEGQK
jgi:cytidyltransferase-like protein